MCGRAFFEISNEFMGEKEKIPFRIDGDFSPISFTFQGCKSQGNTKGKT